MRIQNRTLFAAIFMFVATGLLYGQDSPKPNPERERAFEAYHAGKFVEAMPLLEKLTADNPNDVAALEAWGVSMLGYAQTLSDLDLRKKARARARSILVKAQTLGDNSDLLKTLLQETPEDGSFPVFSDQKDVDAAMQQAEADFARGDLEKARQGYLRAHILNPKYYYAALFIGDTYFKQHEMADAGDWFAQAVQIDPNVETAYRYWGDALLAQDKLDEARSKYIEAIIADPYNQTAWVGLRNWLGKTQLKLNWVKLKDRVAVGTKDNNATITLDDSIPKDDQISMAAWLAYGGSRATWMREKFAKQYPNEAAYRHSLSEETESLHMMITVASEISAQHKLDISTSEFGALQQIEKSGWLQTFVLLNRADKGIAQDYAGYREQNREKIRQYMDEFVVPKTPAQAADSNTSNQ